MLYSWNGILSCINSMEPNDNRATILPQFIDKTFNMDSLPEKFHNITKIENYAFAGCTSLTNIIIPNSVTSIGAYAFDQCESLTSLIIPHRVRTLGYNAFMWCSSLSSVTFKGIPTDIGAFSLFTGCENLTTINVPWSEGAVAGAPWGATNATINYNYTGG